MLEALFGRLERHRHVKNRLAVLLGDNPPRRERPPVADAVHVVDHGHRGIALAEEVAMQGVGNPPLHRPARCDQRLGRDEATEDARPAVVRAEAAKEIQIEGLEVEPPQEAVELGHTAELARQFGDPEDGMWGRRSLDTYTL